jgi:hypothetical protein
MKNIFTYTCFIALFFLAACAGTDSPGYDNSLAPANATKPVTPVTIADTLLSDTATTVASIVSGSKTQVSGTKPQAGTSAALNPAHGQPGHRCDIAVGAPLNSAPATAPQVQTAPVVTTQSASTVPSVSSGTARINPPHGQPGHDCSVQVGAPLKN